MTIDPTRPWSEQALVLVTMTPIRREGMPKHGLPADYDRFCELGLARFERGTIVDTFASLVRHSRWTVCDAAELARLQRHREPGSMPMEQLLEPINEIVDQAIPCAVNAQLAKRLLQAEFFRAERSRKATFDREGRFALRTKSRWVDLGKWRKVARDAEPFAGMDEPIDRRLSVMAERVTRYSRGAPVDPAWSLQALLDWQEKIR
jgi:hypothetical protein